MSKLEQEKKTDEGSEDRKFKPRATWHQSHHRKLFRCARKTHKQILSTTHVGAVCCLPTLNARVKKLIWLSHRSKIQPLSLSSHRSAELPRAALTVLMNSIKAVSYFHWRREGEIKRKAKRHKQSTEAAARMNHDALVGRMVRMRPRGWDETRSVCASFEQNV